MRDDIVGLSPEETVRLGIAIVPEGARVFPEMTVLDNLKMASYIESARLQRIWVQNFTSSTHTVDAPVALSKSM